MISRSAFDLEAVMNTLARSAAEIWRRQTCTLFLRDGDFLVCRGNFAVRRRDAESIASTLSKSTMKHIWGELFYLAKLPTWGF